jgi:hypothetical protein
MKNLKIKSFLACLLLTAIVLSCSKDEMQPKSKTLELNFSPLDNSNTRPSSSEVYTLTIKSTAPLAIVSRDLTVIKVTDSQTGKSLDAIIQNKVLQKKLVNSKALRKAIASGRGYAYDGNDCLIYGTITLYDDGSATFTPADTLTQILMNRCGYANVA